MEPSQVKKLRAVVEKLADEDSVERMKSSVEKTVAAVVTEINRLSMDYCLPPTLYGVMVDLKSLEEFVLQEQSDAEDIYDFLLARSIALGELCLTPFTFPITEGFSDPSIIDKTIYSIGKELAECVMVPFVVGMAGMIEGCEEDGDEGTYYFRVAISTSLSPGCYIARSKFTSLERGNISLEPFGELQEVKDGDVNYSFWAGFNHDQTRSEVSKN